MPLRCVAEIMASTGAADIITKLLFGPDARVNPRPQVLTGKFPVFFFPKCLVFSVPLCYGIHGCFDDSEVPQKRRI